MKQIIRWLPSIIWMLVIFFLSSLQTTGVQTTAINRFYLLKLFHVVEYAILAILIFYASRHYPNSIFIAYLFSITDEYHQTLVSGRHGRPYDTLYDLVGIFFGLYLICITKQFFFTKHRQK